MNKMELKFSSTLDNESLARNAVITFISCLNPTLDEIGEIKTIVSEAVSNSIIHGYCESEGKIEIICRIKASEVFIEISDRGKGIENIEKAMEPLYTTRPEIERSGMGFSFMDAFMDSLLVESKIGQGTKVIMSKKVIKSGN